MSLTTVADIANVMNGSCVVYVPWSLRNIGNLRHYCAGVEYMTVEIARDATKLYNRDFYGSKYKFVPNNLMNLAADMDYCRKGGTKFLLEIFLTDNAYEDLQGKWIQLFNHYIKPLSNEADSAAGLENIPPYGLGNDSRIYFEGFDFYMSSNGNLPTQSRTLTQALLQLDSTLVVKNTMADPFQLQNTLDTYSLLGYYPKFLSYYTQIGRPHRTWNMSRHDHHNRQLPEILSRVSVFQKNAYRDYESGRNNGASSGNHPYRYSMFIHEPLSKIHIQDNNYGRQVIDYVEGLCNAPFVHNEG